MLVTFCALSFSFLDHLSSTYDLEFGFSPDTTHDDKDVVIPLYEHEHCF